MGKNKTNTFKKINYHLKSKQIDEKLELLNEIPTNNTSGIYVVEPEYITTDIGEPEVPVEPEELEEPAAPPEPDEPEVPEPVD